MNTKEILRTLTGSVFVYAIVASCSPSSSGDGPNGQLGMGGGAGASTAGAPHAAASSSNGGMTMAMRDASTTTDGHTQTGNGGRSILDAALDRMTHPVPDAHAEPYQSGSRLRAKYLIGDDGSKQFWGWHDSQRNEDCIFEPATDGVMRCIPITGATLAYDSSYFSDSGCAKKVASTAKKAGCSTPAPKYVLESASDACSAATTRFMQVGAEIQASSLYQGTSSTCMAVSPTQATTLADANIFYAIGAQIDPKTFVSATVSTE